MGRAIKELRTKNTQELEQGLRERREELYNLRFQAASEQLINPRLVRNIKRDIARIHTIIHERSK